MSAPAAPLEKAVDFDSNVIPEPMFVSSDSTDYTGRLAWLYFAEARGTLTDGEKRDIVYLERRIFGTSRDDEARAAKVKP